MAGMTVAADTAGLAASLVSAGAVLADLSPVFQTEGQAALAGAQIPVDTGKLANLSTVVAGADGFTLTSAATYAGYVHAVNPFFVRAIDARAAAILDAVTDHAESALSTVEGR